MHPRRKPGGEGRKKGPRAGGTVAGSELVLRSQSTSRLFAFVVVVMVIVTVHTVVVSRPCLRRNPWLWSRRSRPWSSGHGHCHSVTAIVIRSRPLSFHHCHCHGRGHRRWSRRPRPHCHTQRHRRRGCRLPPPAHARRDRDGDRGSEQNFCHGPRPRRAQHAWGGPSRHRVWPLQLLTTVIASVGAWQRARPFQPAPFTAMTSGLFRRRRLQP